MLGLTSCRRLCYGLHNIFCAQRVELSKTKVFDKLNQSAIISITFELLTKVPVVYDKIR